MDGWNRFVSAVLSPFGWIGRKVMKISEPVLSDRTFFMTVSILEVIAGALLFGWIATALFGSSLLVFMIGVVIWTAVVGYTPLVNSFFIVVPKNSGAVIANTFRTYEKFQNRTRLEPTKALREVGPGLHGILLWEKVGWIIDLGKQIILDKPVTTYSKDHIELIIDWQVILTPLQGYLVNLVRHDDDTVRRYFEGRFRSKLIEVVSKEYAQDVLGNDDETVKTQSIFEKIESLKNEFNCLFGGPEGESDEERQFGTFTNDPQLLKIQRSPEFQKSVESLSINRNNARALKTLEKEAELDPNLALITVLASQGKPTDNIIDIDLGADVTGLDNLRNMTVGFVPGVGGKFKPGGKGQKGQKGEKGNE